MVIRRKVLVITLAALITQTTVIKPANNLRRSFVLPIRAAQRLGTSETTLKNLGLVNAGGLVNLDKAFLHFAPVVAAKVTPDVVIPKAYPTFMAVVDAPQAGTTSNKTGFFAALGLGGAGLYSLSLLSPAKETPDTAKKPSWVSRTSQNVSSWWNSVEPIRPVVTIEGSMSLDNLANKAKSWLSGWSFGRSKATTTPDNN